MLVLLCLVFWLFQSFKTMLMPPPEEIAEQLLLPVTSYTIAYEVCLAMLLTALGLAMAYHGRKIVHSCRHIFGFLCGVGIFFFLLKTQDLFEKGLNPILIAVVGISFGIMGLLAVHFISFLLTVCLGILLGATLYSMLITLPYLYPTLISQQLLRYALMGTLIVASIVVVHYCDYLAIIGTTAVVGAFIAILGTDVIIKSGINDAFMHGIKQFQHIKPTFWIWLQIILMIGTVIVGSLHQLTLF